jgi:hypothetical protein
MSDARRKAIPAAAVGALVLCLVIGFPVNLAIGLDPTSSNLLRTSWWLTGFGIGFLIILWVALPFTRLKPAKTGGG